MKYHIDFELELRKNSYSGTYIVLEGTEGSGKSTQVERLIEYYKEQEREVIKTREPRKEGLIGEMVHKILLGDLKMNPVAFQYLFSADRMLHHKEIIEPALKSGKIVISDRNFWSAVVYGIVDKLDGEYNTKNMNQLLVSQSILSFYHQFIAPDVTFYLNIPLDVSLQRISIKKDAKEIYEEESKIKKIIDGYNFVVKHFSDNIVTIDGTKSKDEVTADLISTINQIKK